MENIFDSTGVVEAGEYSSDNAKGMNYDVIMDGKSHRIVMITEIDYNVDVPYMYNQTRMDEKEREIALAKVIQHEIEKGNDWAKDMKETAITVWNMMKAEGGKITYPLSDCDVCISPCVYDIDKNFDDVQLQDVEFYLVYSHVVNGGHSIFDVTSSLVNYEQVKANHEKSKSDLQSFYEKNVMPIEDKSFDDMTEDEKDIMGTFSDWHKDIYGHRPRSYNNECKNALSERAKTQKERE